MTNELEIIDLDNLVKPVSRIRLFGKTHDVLPASGRVAELLQQIQRREQGGEAAGLMVVTVMKEIVKECLPTLSEEDNRKINFDQISAVVGLSTGRVEEIKKMIEAYEKNGHAPVVAKPATPAPTAQKSSTKSAARSSR